MTVCSSQDDKRCRGFDRAVRLVLLAALVVGLGVWVYAGWVRPNLVPRNFGVVEAGKVYRSAALTPGATRRVQERYGIRTIVDLGGFDKDPVGERVAGRTAAALGVKRYVFALEGDGRGNPNAYVAALRVMTDPANQPVLVHCSAGAQRTSGCVMLYKDAALGESFDETYGEARGFGHDPARNPFLRPYLEEHGGAIRGVFEDGGSVVGWPEVRVNVRAPDEPARR